ncbi:MAG: hypothetical protein H0W99_02460 [Acidobacteria bacterium]|nr:hypothetical protein [Acidobacteriota bacterium]
MRPFERACASSRPARASASASELAQLFELASIALHHVNTTLDIRSLAHIYIREKTLSEPVRHA